MLLLATAIVSVVFILWPGLDLTISGWFGGAGGFGLVDQPLAELARQVLMWASRLVALLMFIWLIFTLSRGAAARVNWRLPAFAMTALVLGPWVVVNEIFKTHWGRARPRDVAEFGGDAVFTPAWHMADQCARNCSFVSGESGMSVAVTLLIALLFCPDLRRSHLWLLGALAVIGAGLRIIVGAHFASDVILSGLICALIIMLCFVAFNVAAYRCAGLARAIWADIRWR